MALAVPVLLVALLGAAPALSQAPASPRAMIRLAKPGESPPPATIAQLAWLEGHWIGDMPNGPVEHVILSARHGQMPSFVRSLKPGAIDFYEISVFAEAGGSVVNRVKHFTPELHGWEPRDVSIERALVERRDDDLFFDGLTIDRTGPDAFDVYFLPVVDGQERETIVVPFRRKR